jgi:ABC-type phosphate transport system substrate-binding protein
MKTRLGIVVLFATFLISSTVTCIAQSDSDYVIIAGKEVAGNSIPASTLKGIYLREIKRWGNGSAIIPVDLATGSSFYQNLFGKSYVQMQAYWLNMRIKYSVDLPISKKDPESVKKFVTENKGAIGFIKSSDVDDSVKVLLLKN